MTPTWTDQAPIYQQLADRLGPRFGAVTDGDSPDRAAVLLRVSLDVGFAALLLLQLEWLPPWP